MAIDERYNHLVELGGSDFKIVDGEPNIKGWDVKNATGQLIGDVHELLFDPELRKVRYLVVDLDSNTLGIEQDKKVLIPIGIAELYNRDGVSQSEIDEESIEDQDLAVDHDPEARMAAGDEVVHIGDPEAGFPTEGAVYSPSEDGEVVIAPVTAAQLLELPAYEQGNVTSEAELIVRHVFEGQFAQGLAARATTVYNKNEFYTHEHFNEDKFYHRTKPTVNPGEDLDEDLRPL